MNLAAATPAWLAAILCLLLLLAAAEDSWRLRISNWLSGAIALSAIAAMILAGPQLAVWENILVFVGLLTIGTFLFSAGKLGGGDVKLMAATGLWFQLLGALWYLVSVALAGGVLALLIILLRRIRWSDATRDKAPILRKRGGIPYGIAIATGALITIALLRGWSPLAPAEPANPASLERLNVE